MQQQPPQEGPYEVIWPQEYPPLDYKRVSPNVAQLYQDELDRRTSVTNASGRAKPDYRPVSLRWWFISILILVFVGLGALVLYANHVMRGSDNTAKVEDRSLSHDEAWILYRDNMAAAAVYARQAGASQPGNPASTANDVAPPAASDAPSAGGQSGTAPAPTLSEGQQGGADPADGARKPAGGGSSEALPDGYRVTTGYVEVPASVTVTKPGETTVVDVTSLVTTKTTKTSLVTTTIPASGTPPGSTSPSQRVTTSYEVIGPSTITITRTPSSTPPAFAPGGNGTDSEVPEQPGGEQVVTTILPATSIPHTLTVPAGGGGGGGGVGGGIPYVPGKTYVYTSTIVEDHVSTMVSQKPTTKAGATYATLGVSRVYSTYTLNRAGDIVQAPMTKIQTSEIAGTAITVVETPHTTTQVKTAAAGQLITNVATASQGQLVTQVATASEGQLITQVSTGADGQLTTQVLTASEGQLVTQVLTASDGQLIDMVATASEGQLLTVVSTQGATTRVTSIPPTRAIITSVTTPTADAGVRVVVEATEYTLTPAGYFIGKFVPPLIAVLIALAIRAVDQTAKLYQPFVALSRPQGVPGRDSLALHFDGWKGFWRPFTMLSDGHAVPFITTLAVWGAVILAPLASGAVGLKIHGHCAVNAIDGCALSLGITSAAAYGLIALLGIIAILLLILMVVISTSWKTGVFADPWCIAGMAALARNPDVRILSRLDFRTLKTTIAERQFALGWFRNVEGREEYGIVLQDESGRSLHGPLAVNPAYGYEPAFLRRAPGETQRKAPTTFAALTFWWRIAFMAYLVVLLAIVLYYHLSNHIPSTFKRLMEKERFAARFISSGLGVIVILCWECVYTSVAIVAPYRRMAGGLQAADRSVLSRRPTYAVTGLFWGIRDRDPLVFMTALMAVLAELLPITLANVPYDLTQTRLAHDVCARLSAGLLLVMIVALLTLMFVRWPTLPIDPRSIIGSMWYVSEARWVDRLEGVTTMTAPERKRRMCDLGGRWFYGPMDSRVGERLLVEMQDVYRSMEYGGFR